MFYDNMMGMNSNMMGMHTLWWVFWIAVVFGLVFWGRGGSPARRDLGRPDDLIMRAPAPIEQADYIVAESTYGDRLHEASNAEKLLHHLKALAPHSRNSIVFAGFQAGGTRGGRIVAGESSIRIHGEDVPINAEVVSLPGMSAHADAEQIVQWLKTAPKAPKGIYLNHGEPGPADALRQRIERELGWPATVPRLGQTVEIV